jgi:hypothetical protein
MSNLSSGIDGLISNSKAIRAQKGAGMVSNIGKSCASCPTFFIRIRGLAPGIASFKM